MRSRIAAAMLPSTPAVRTDLPRLARLRGSLCLLARALPFHVGRDPPSGHACLAHCCHTNGRVGRCRFVHPQEDGTMAHQSGQVPFDCHPRLWWGFMGVALLLFCTTVAGAAPANDEIANATVITALPFTDGPLTTTTTATTAPDDPSCAGNGHTVWYVVTPAT